MRTIKILSFVLSLLLLFSFSPQAYSDNFSVLSFSSVSPSVYSCTLEPGQSQAFDISVKLDTKPVPPMDFVFAFDISHSMAPLLESAKSNAMHMMSTIQSKVPDSKFGVVSFSDYPGHYTFPGYVDYYGYEANDPLNPYHADKQDEPYVINQHLTWDLTLASDAIQSLDLRSGGDDPECYSRVLYELISSRWRADTKKIVIMFGDAPVHDLSFAGYNYGGDPGRDGIAGTADDLFFSNVVSMLREEKVIVFGVQVGTFFPATATFKGMSVGFADSPGTNGQYYNLTDAKDLQKAIQSMVDKELETIKHLTLEVPENYKSWFSSNPTSFTNVPYDSLHKFQASIFVPENTPDGEHSFLVTVLGDGKYLGSVSVTIITKGTGQKDFGFRSNPDGFNFSNFGHNDLPWEMFEQFYGKENVKHLNKRRIYVANQYYQLYYRGLAEGGCCFGFTSASMINYARADQSNAGYYALPWYNPLYSADFFDPGVFQSICYYQASQLCYEKKKHIYAGLFGLDDHDPNYFAGKIADYFSNGQLVNVCVWGPGGGHSIMAYRLVSGNDMAFVYVYDSNFPGDNNRFIAFDLQNNTWSYNIWGTTIWSGDDYWPNMAILPLSMLTKKGIPPWKQPEHIYGMSGSGYLMLTDDQGRRSGYDGTDRFNEIPDVVDISPIGYNPNQTQPAFRQWMVPNDKSLTASIIGEKQGKADFSVFSNNTMIQLNELDLAPDSQDLLQINSSNNELVFMSKDKKKPLSATFARDVHEKSRAVSMKTQINQGDLTTISFLPSDTFSLINQGKAKSYEMTFEQVGENSASLMYYAPPIDTHHRHYLTVGNWNELDSTHLLLSIDFQNDGTIDQEIQTPSKPTQVGGKADKDQIHLYWQKSNPGSNSLSGYQIYRSNAANPDGKAYPLAFVQGGENTTYTDQSGQSGQSYTYYVVAVDSNNFDSPLSEKITLGPVHERSKPLLQISAELGKPEYFKNEEMFIRLSVFNRGDSTSTNTQVLVTLPPELDYLRTSRYRSEKLTPSTVMVTIGAIAPYSVQTFQVDLKVNTAVSQIKTIPVFFDANCKEKSSDQTKVLPNLVPARPGSSEIYLGLYYRNALWDHEKGTIYVLQESKFDLDFMISIQSAQLPYKLAVNWGDGVVDEFRDLTDSNLQLSHSFLSKGFKELTIMVTDRYGRNKQANLKIEVR